MFFHIGDCLQYRLAFAVFPFTTALFDQLLHLTDHIVSQIRNCRQIPVYEIGESVGYKDAKYFSQQFMKVVGVKPAEYRKLYY